MIWKQLVGEEPGEEDIFTSDAYTFQSWKDLRENAKKCSKEEFEAAIDENFVLNINGRMIPLCEGGEDKQVNLDNYEEYIKLSKEKMLGLAEKQMKWVREGMFYIVPESIVTFLNW